MIMRYLSGTNNLGLIYHNREAQINVYSDADWGHSTSGILIDLCGSPIIYKSKKQTIIASSTTEADFIAANHAVKELVWLTTLMSE